LFKQVYEALRESPVWNETLFIITYDEHGGFYDHVSTPLKVPNPDGLNSTAPDPEFNFTRIGVRVPTVMISPWIDKHTIISKPNGPVEDSEFEHTSIAATLKKMFDLPNFLTKRDEWAGTFEHVFMNRTEPRTDCPMKLPSINKPSKALLETEKSKPTTDLQDSFLILASSLNNLDYSKYQNLTQFEAGVLTQSLFENYLM